MSEGLSGTEVGKEIAEHAKHSGGHDARDRRDRLLSIAEAALLSLVTLAAAWSGYAAAKWNGESAVLLTVASEARTDASRADLDAREDRNFDLSTFEAWFDAYVADDQEAMAIAERRFRPEFAIAFDAWRATNPETNPAAPRGPTYMPQYRQPRLDQAKALDEKADEAFAAGVSAGQTSDDYIRVTVFLASVLFLVGISTHFPSRGVRYALIALSAAVLVVALVQLAQLLDRRRDTGFHPQRRGRISTWSRSGRHHRTPSHPPGPLRLRPRVRSGRLSLLTKASPLWPLRSRPVPREPDQRLGEPIRGPGRRFPS